MKTVNKLDYLYRKLVVKAREQHDETVEITDDDYEKYYVTESWQDDPIPGSDIPIPGEDENEHDYSKDYLTFEALEDGTFSFTVNDLYYSTNNGVSWKSLAAGTETELIKAGTKVLWKRGKTLKISGNTYSDDYTGIFSSTGQFNISGNILSLFYTSNFSEYNILPNYVLNTGPSLPYNCKSLFGNCIHLINANNLILPLNLTDNCYRWMFSGCKSLISAPKLPATTLTDYCYNGMFINCSSLQKAPELPAKTLKYLGHVYDNMFQNCISLNYIKCLAINLNVNNLDLWVEGVSPSGTFIKNSKTTFDIGPSGIPAGWEVIDEVVPEE